MEFYNPYDWYWLADDGRLYSSRVQGEIQNTDPGYVAWDVAYDATVWPRDDNGDQTAASLQEVLLPFGLAVDLKAYAFMERQQIEWGGCAISGIAGMTDVRTDPASQGLINRYNQAAASDASFTVPWVQPDRSTIVLTSADCNSLFNQTTAFIRANYQTYESVVSDIDGGTITTIAQIDAAFGTTLKRGSKIDIGWKT